jgi:sec-independent protein translocase protein TatA
MGLSNPVHIAIILLVVVLLFGAKRLPELGRSLGEGMRGFKDSIQGTSEDEQKPPALTEATRAEPAPPPPVAQAPTATQPAAPAAEPPPARQPDGV